MIKKIMLRVLNKVYPSPYTQIIFGNSYLKKTGYIKSLKEKVSVDCNGSPVPWWTYSFVDFFIKKTDKKIKVFEYGSGNSTIFMAPFVNYIVSVEHDLNWYEMIKKQTPENVNLSFVSESEYVESIGDGVYDIVIIDGLYRNECAYRALKCLSSEGVIVFDDTDRSDYDPAYSFLKKYGFKRLDFVGLSPGSFHENSTSVFYREVNVFKI